MQENNINNEVKKDEEIEHIDINIDNKKEDDTLYKFLILFLILIILIGLPLIYYLYSDNSSSFIGKNILVSAIINEFPFFKLIVIVLLVSINSKLRKISNK